jgi:hypothetical protein
VTKNIRSLYYDEGSRPRYLVMAPGDQELLEPLLRASWKMRNAGLDDEDIMEVAWRLRRKEVRP